MRPHFRCVIHGSLRKHLREMGEAMQTFREAGIEVLAPQLSAVTREDDGFLFFRGEEHSDPRLIELLYLQNLKRLGRNGFSYFVNPHGYIGKSVSYELGIAHALNVPSFFLAKPADHPIYIEKEMIRSPEDIVAHIHKHQALPAVHNRGNMAQLWKQLVVPSSVVSTGAIIEYDSGHEREVMMVRTHKWRNQFSVVGGKVRRHEKLPDALRRTIKTETGLDGVIGRHLCTFDEIQHAGYYASSEQRIFVDNVVRVDSKRVLLNEDAQEYVWLPARHALNELSIEPNARHTLELYVATQKRG